MGSIPIGGLRPWGARRVEEGRGYSRTKRRPVSPPRSSNRTCGFPASGSPTGFTMRHTEVSFAPQYSSFGNVRPTSVWLGSSPIIGSRFLRKHPEVRTLPSTGITRFRRYCDPLRRPDRTAGLSAGVWSCLPPFRASPNYPDRLACMPFPLPRRTEPVRVSVASRPVLPSPLFRRVGVHDFTFEACSGFTRVTACTLAPSPFSEVCHEALT